MLTRLIAISIGALTLLAALLPADVNPQSKRDAPVPVEEIELRGIRGKLGRPLGEVVSVEGPIIDGQVYKTKFSSYHFYLKVDVLNGKKLETPVTIMLREQDMQRVAVGARAKLIGWEDGGCRGTVEDPNHLWEQHKDAVNWPDIGYAFVSEFAVDRVIQ